MTAISGSTVLLCGASGGLGRALAVELHRRGAVLTLHGRDGTRLDALPVPGERITGDLRDPEVCTATVALATGPSGGIDVLINAAGVVAFGPAAETPPAVLREVLETNALVPMLLAGAALGTIRSGGTIVNLSGVIAEPNQAPTGMAAYAAAKAAVRAFDGVLAREARRAGVRVLDARPPHTESGLPARAIAGAPPAFPAGLAPEHVAAVICDGIESGARDLPSEAFAA